MEIGSRQDSSQLPRKTRIRLALAELTIRVFLCVGKRAVPAAHAAEIARSPRPCWRGQPVPGASEAPKVHPPRSGLAHAGTHADLEGHLVRLGAVVAVAGQNRVADYVLSSRPG